MITSFFAFLSGLLAVLFFFVIPCFIVLAFIIGGTVGVRNAFRAAFGPKDS